MDPSLNRKKSAALLGFRSLIRSSKKNKSVKSASSVYDSEFGRSSVLLTDQSRQDSADIRGEAVDFSTPRALLPNPVANQSDVFEEDSLYVTQSKYSELQEQFDELHKRNAELYCKYQDATQKLQEHQQLIGRLTDQLANVHGEFEVEKQTLLNKHEQELKQKDAEMIEKELSALQSFSLNKTAAEKNESSRFGQSNIQSRSQLSNASVPGQRPMSSNSLISKDRHRIHLFAASSNQQLPDSKGVILLFRDLVTYAFHLHNSSDAASQFTNDWLNNFRPKICNSQLRVSFAELSSKLKSMNDENIEQILAQTIELLKDNVDTLFGLKRDLVELHKRDKSM